MKAEKMPNESIEDKLTLCLKAGWSGDWATFVKFLKDTPDLAKAKDKFGSTLLLEVAHCAPVQVLKNLIQIGADVNERGKDGYTCLHSIIDEWPGEPNLIEKAKLILDHHYQTELVGPNGWTTLHQSAAVGWTEMAELLLNYGAEMNHRADADEHETPLMVAGRKKRKEIIQLLLEKGADPMLKDDFGDNAQDKAPRRLKSLFDPYLQNV